MTRYTKRRPLQKRVTQTRRKIVKRKLMSRQGGLLSEIVINLKTPVRTPGGSILKSVSDRISRSPGTQKDHSVARLIISAVPASGQSVLDKKLSLVQTVNPGMWERFKKMVSENKEDAIGIAAILGSISVAAVIKVFFPGSKAAGAINHALTHAKHLIHGHTPIRETHAEYYRAIEEMKPRVWECIDARDKELDLTHQIQGASPGMADRLRGYMSQNARLTRTECVNEIGKEMLRGNPRRSYLIDADYAVHAKGEGVRGYYFSEYV